MSTHTLPPIRECDTCGYRTYEPVDRCPECRNAMPEICARCRETLDEHLLGNGACGRFQEETI